MHASGECLEKKGKVEESAAVRHNYCFELLLACLRLLACCKREDGEEAGELFPYSSVTLGTLQCPTLPTP